MTFLQRRWTNGEQHRKIRSTSLVIKEMQIKTKSSNFMLTRIALIITKKLENKHWQLCGKWKPCSDTTGENVNAVVTEEKFHCSSSVVHKITICLISSCLRNVPSKIKLYPWINVYSTQTSINRWWINKSWHVHKMEYYSATKIGKYWYIS